MPEPATAGDQGSQIEQNANTPQATADQPTKSVSSVEAPSLSVMDYLDIPAELQARLAPKAEEAPPETQPEPPTEIPNEQPEELERDEEEEAEPEAELPPAAEKVDKRLKRINRLTRQKSELEDQLDKLATANSELRQQLENGQAKTPQAKPPGLAGGRLQAIEAEIKSCDAMLEWCDDNPDGGILGSGDSAIEADAATARFWRRKAETDRQEKIVEKREELWNLEQARKVSDQNAYQLWPEMFDKSNPDFQQAVTILRQYPWLQALPEANIIVGTFLEGQKKLNEKLKARNGQAQKPRRDLDERVFGTPRVPISPHTPEPPSREATPSSTKRYTEAMSKLINDPDGGAGHVAAVFAAQEAASRKQPSNRSPVRT